MLPPPETGSPQESHHKHTTAQFFNQSHHSVIDVLHYETIFTLQERRHGAVIIHTFICLYCFVALAILCDNYFCASLEKLCKRLRIPTDVAGATFMAAGSSMPTLFIAIASVFMGEGDIGLGTIIGSSMFNILFITAICGLFSGMVISLHTWPIVRDSCVYVVNLVGLLIVIHDNVIHFYEALIFPVLYTGYILIMVFNTRLENAFESAFETCCDINKGMEMVEMEDPLEVFDIDVERDTSQGDDRGEQVSKDITGDGGVKADSESITLMDEVLSDRSVLNESEREGKIEPDNEQIDRNDITNRGHNEGNKRKGHNERRKETEPKESEKRNKLTELDGATHNKQNEDKIDEKNENEHNKLNEHCEGDSHNEGKMDKENERIEQKEDATKSGASGSHQNTPSHIHGFKPSCPFTPPSTFSKRIVWIFMLPVHLAFYVTMPDCRVKKWEAWYPATFALSIIWMAALSYVLVWTVSIIGETFSIPEYIMGLTLLAAGSSVPDVMSSLIVAKHGMGDMALANCIGSNIFDVLCLGLPWLLATTAVHPNSVVLIHSGHIVYVSMCLFGTVLTIVSAIHLNGWRLDRRLGVILFIAYAFFLTSAVILEAIPGRPAGQGMESKLIPHHPNRLPRKRLGHKHKAGTKV